GHESFRALPSLHYCCLAKCSIIFSSDFHGPRTRIILPQFCSVRNCSANEVAYWDIHFSQERNAETNRPAGWRGKVCTKSATLICRCRNSSSNPVYRARGNVGGGGFKIGHDDG